ncbi:hypothetical protein MNQ98_10015 [Paenibacillus sp. N3/727]|uniref:hypothetical protein n=1 Tax=Paenibacillus sp. N3/727 TaxID=2925845 RepID=UPI001F52CF45|nr:hypothetical protein [Paenibacillus sp. N3/727]UNK20315.1 hypothetical protein MNQ98_10015 [Paenibacillus sp. N3/727]
MGRPLYNRPFMKLLSAVVSTLSISPFTGIYNYVPMNDQSADVYYFSFSYEIAISSIINLALFLFLIMPLVV